MSVSLLDKRTAIFLAAVCSQTYHQFDNDDGTFMVPRNYQVSSSFKAASFIGVEERFGFILESNDRIILAFRGTNTSSDWVSDAIARQSPFVFVRDGGLVHRGFLDIYRSARKRILDALSKLSPQKQLYITGHSLGGALATLCAADAAVNTKFKTPVVYSYASPRVGNPAFAGKFNSLLSNRHRIYNQYDLVPHLPPVLYKSPRTDRIYQYLHVKKGFELSFQKGSVSANHAIGNYFHELAKLDPAYTRDLSARNPGFCPG
ncbi:lipase family protein [Paenibacillus sedimenti]|uniref:Lipase family protein n=1 Tax=Paenibacillus sedimenti TaxID=2770274 RepID=A0A926KTJ1_9BACL|nr:lipase family protein [Paenibacillus sedimenti]MBD0381968.1 lipase family protein [Paenibacillus sedimenti]